MMDPAVRTALDEALAAAVDQTDGFRLRFGTLIELVLTGNFEDPDVRRVMEMITVSAEAED